MVFYSCGELTQINVPEGVVFIGQGAFTDCVSLASIALPESLTDMGDIIFHGCSSLTQITFSSKLTVMPNGLLANTGIEEYTIPDHVVELEMQAFNNAQSLKRLTIPTSVTKIGNSSFNYCISLTYIYYLGTMDQWARVDTRSANIPDGVIIVCTDGEIAIE